MASAIGSATLDFGSAPGSNEASVVVTGQTNIINTCKVDAFIMADSTTSDHTANDHRYVDLFLALTCGTPTTGTGFTIYATSTEKLTGTYQVQWVWAI